MGSYVCLYSSLLCLQKLRRAKEAFGNYLNCPVCHEATFSAKFLPQGWQS